MNEREIQAWWRLWEKRPWPEGEADADSLIGWSIQLDDNWQ